MSELDEFTSQLNAGNEEAKAIQTQSAQAQP